MASSERLGRYRLIERLGEGGMGIVYRAALDLPGGFDREVVIKRLHPSLQREPKFAQQLAEEARLSALLEHPSIVQVFDFAQHAGERFVVMEYVDGVDLSALTRRARALSRPLPAGLVAYVMFEAAAALAYAHSRCDREGRPLGIIHRDVSPSNLMVTSAGKAKLLDFGVARAASQVQHEGTRTGVFQGKLGYLSPEQAEGLPIDHRVDLFALGVVFHECLTLERLFRGSDDLDTLRLVRQAEIAPPGRSRNDVDAALDAVVMKLLARVPAERFADGGEVVEALRPIVHRLRGDAASLRRLLSELAPIETGRAPLEASRASRRRRWTAIAAAGVIAAGVVATGVAAVTWRATRSPHATAAPIAQPEPVAQPESVAQPAPIAPTSAHPAAPTLAPPVAPPARRAVHATVRAPAAHVHAAKPTAPARPQKPPAVHDPNAVKDPFGQ